MASLAVNFTTATKRVSDFLGFTSTYDTAPTGANLTRCQDIVYRAYRKFLFPMNPDTKQVHIWSFLRKTGTLITEASKYQYTLPSDFVGLVSGFKFDAGENKDNPQKIDISKLRAKRSISTGTTDNPDFYAITSGLYSLETGTTYEVWFCKTPNTALTYKYIYIFDPEKPSATTDLFVGGIRAGEVVLALALGIAEVQEDDTPGPRSTEADKLLSDFINFDLMYNPTSIEFDPNMQESIPSFRRIKLMGGTPTGGT
jgi:hypothetical protein